MMHNYFIVHMGGKIANLKKYFMFTQNNCFPLKIYVP